MWHGAWRWKTPYCRSSPGGWLISLQTRPWMPWFVKCWDPLHADLGTLDKEPMASGQQLQLAIHCSQIDTVETRNNPPIYMHAAHIGRFQCHFLNPTFQSLVKQPWLGDWWRSHAHSWPQPPYARAASSCKLDMQKTLKTTTTHTQWITRNIDWSDWHVRQVFLSETWGSMSPCLQTQNVLAGSTGRIERMRSKHRSHEAGKVLSLFRG